MISDLSNMKHKDKTMTPNFVRDFAVSYLFGRIKFSYTLEDRRPDLSEDEAITSLGYKYKMLINVRFFGFTVSIVAHTPRPGLLKVNDRVIP